jgi:hypothetical protein
MLTGKARPLTTVRTARFGSSTDGAGACASARPTRPAIAAVITIAAAAETGPGPRHALLFICRLRRRDRPGSWRA